MAESPIIEYVVRVGQDRRECKARAHLQKRNRDGLRDADLCTGGRRWLGMDVKVQDECEHMVGPSKQNFGSCEMIRRENRHLTRINGEPALTLHY